MRTEVARDIRESFTARSEEDAQRLLDLGTEKYEKKASTLVAWMINNIHDGFGVFKLSRSHRRGCRPTNGVENLNKQLKRRRRVASLFPNAASRLRLISVINDGNQRRLGVWKTQSAHQRPMLRIKTFTDEKLHCRLFAVHRSERILRACGVGFHN
jgi:transposase-like protein